MATTGTSKEVHELTDPTYQLRPIGRVESPLTDRAAAPKQGDEGAPRARVVFLPGFLEAASGLREGHEAVEEDAITVRDLEAIDGTPVLDVKPVLGKRSER